MKWTRERAALIVCGAGVGGFTNFWVTLTSPWAGLFVPVLGGIIGMWLLAGVNK